MSLNLDTPKKVGEILSPKFTEQKNAQKLNQTQATTQNTTIISAEKSQSQLQLQNLSALLPKIEGRGIKEDHGFSNMIMNTSNSALDLSKSRIFPDESRSVVMSRKGSASFLEMSPTAWSKSKEYSMPSTPASNNNIVRTPQNGNRSKEFLQANFQHEKSRKLLDFLEKRTEKRSQSLQQRMMDAMDRSIKKGPLKFPQKLIKQLYREQTTKKSFQTQQKQLKEEEANSTENYQQQELQESSTEAHFGEAQTSEKKGVVLPDFADQHNKRDPQLPPRRATVSKTKFINTVDNPNASESHGQVFEKHFIPAILEQSVNLKLRDDYNERKKEFEKVLQDNKVKVKQRAQIAVNKLLTTDLTLDEVCYGGNHLSRAVTERSNLIKKSEMNAKTIELCQAYTGLKRFETGNQDEDDVCVNKEQKLRAIQKLKGQLERQRSLLQKSESFNKEDQALYDKIIQEEIVGQEEKLSSHSTKLIKNAAQSVIEEKFMSIGENKLQKKTVQLLFNQVIKQIRAWSGKHADLLLELIKRKDLMKSESNKLVKQEAHIVKDRLAKTVAKLQTRLQDVDNIVMLKLGTIDIARRAQANLEKNFDKAMELYHSGNKTRIKAESQLAELQKNVVKVLPNFTKYQESEILTDGLRYILPEQNLEPDQMNNLWDVMLQRMKYDNLSKDMWGFNNNQNISNVKYQGQTLEQRYNREELWLRSDVSRLLELFEIATPCKITVQEYEKQIKQINHENYQLGRTIKNQNMELKTRYDLLQQLQKKEFSSDQQLKELKELQSFVQNLKAEKVDQMTQADFAQLVDIPSQENLTLKNLNQKNSKRSKSRRKGLVNLDLGVPKQKSDVYDKQEQALKSLENKVKWMDSKDAQKRLQKMIDIEMDNILVPLNQASLEETESERQLDDQKREILMPYCQTLCLFIERALQQFPQFDGSAWELYCNVLRDQNMDLMQGLQDLELLAHEDWRFGLIQLMSGINYNKVEIQGMKAQNTNIRNVIIDKRDSTQVYVALSLINHIQKSISVIKFFEQPLQPEKEYIIDLDLVLSSLTKSIKTLLHGNKPIKRAIMPQLLGVIYENLFKSVGKVEGYLNESQSHTRHLFTFVIDELAKSQDHIEVKFMINLIYAIHYHGLGDFEAEMDHTEVTYEMLEQLIENHFSIEIPDELKDADEMAFFIQKRILTLRKAQKNDKRPEAKLCHADLRQIQSMYIKHYLTFKDAMIIGLRAAQGVVKLRQSIFEPIFNHYKQGDGYLALTGSFYQCLLFISKCNIATSFVDPAEQQKLYDRINKRTRKLIETLRNQEQFKKIGLANFTNVCYDLGLTGQINSALRKLGRSDILIQNDDMLKIQKGLQKINDTKAELNCMFHGQVRSLLARKKVDKIIAETSERMIYSVSSKYCSILLVNRFTHNMVFNPLKPLEKRSSFDIFLDCSLAELAMMIQASKSTSKEEKKKRKNQLSLQAQKQLTIQLQKRVKTLETELRGAYPFVSQINPSLYGDTKVVNNSNVGDTLSQIQLSKINVQKHVVQDIGIQTDSNYEAAQQNHRHFEMQNISQSADYDQEEHTLAKQNKADQSRSAVNYLLQQDNLEKIFKSASRQKEQEARQRSPVCNCHKEAHRGPLEDLDDKIEEALKYQSQNLQIKAKCHSVCHMQKQSMEINQQAKITLIDNQQSIDNNDDIQQEIKGGDLAALQQLKPTATLTEFIQSQNTLKMMLTQNFSDISKLRESMPNFVTNMTIKEPIVEVITPANKGHSPINELSMLLYSQKNPKEYNNDGQTSILKTSVVTGENKWREDAQKHQERIQESRMNQHARYKHINSESGRVHQSSFNNPKLPLNNDLAQINDKSSFAGSSVQSPIRLGHSYSPEHNRRFTGIASVNQITMNGAPPRFQDRSAKNLKGQSRSPKRKRKLTTSPSNKAVQTLKLLQSFKEKKLPETKPIEIKNFAFDEQLIKGGFEPHLMEQELKQMEQLDLTGVTQGLGGSFEGLDLYSLEEEKSQTNKNEIPTLGITKMNIVQREIPIPHLKITKNEEITTKTIERMGPNHTLRARYSDHDEKSDHDQDKDE